MRVFPKFKTGWKGEGRGRPYGEGWREERMRKPQA